MKVKITDSQTLKAIAPSDVTAYLRNHDWQNVDSWGNKATIWVLGDNDEQQLIVPVSAEASDYSLRISEILSTLASVEERSETLIYADIVTENEDLVRFRAIHPTSDDGSIPLRDGLKLIEGAYNMLVSSATVVDNKRALLPNRKPNEAMKFIEQARIGQTERGSYVVVIRSSVEQDTELAKAVLFPENNELQLPYNRRVLQTLAETLNTLQSITTQVDPENAGETVLEENIRDFVERGGSLDFCQAVDELNQSAQEQDVEISFTWATSVPVDSQLPDSFRVTTRMATLSQRMITTIQRQLVNEDKVVTGVVYRLDRAPTDFIAVVTIDGLVDERKRRVRLEIQSEDDHKMLIRAYETHEAISCKGNLVKRGRYNYLEDYTDLKLIEE